MLKLSEYICETLKCREYVPLLVALDILQRFRPSKKETVKIARKILHIDPTFSPALDILETYRGRNATRYWGLACIDAINHSSPYDIGPVNKARFSRGARAYVLEALQSGETNTKEIEQRFGWWRQYFGEEFYDRTFQSL